MGCGSSSAADVNTLKPPLPQSPAVHVEVTKIQKEEDRQPAVTRTGVSIPDDDRSVTDLSLDPEGVLDA